MQSSASNPPQSPVAIVGMACRLPGAEGLEQLWDLLLSGRQAIRRLPDHRLDRRLYFDSRKGQRGKTYSDLGGLVDERSVDLDLCGLDAREAARWDPCHLAMCEVACQAMRDALMDVGDKRSAGVYIGHSGGSPLGSDLVLGTLAGETAQLLRRIASIEALPQQDVDSLIADLTASLRRDAPRRQADGGPALDANAVAHLISQALRLTGPSMAIEAACASSLVALLAAVQAVQSRQVDFAIAGGASYAKADSLVLFSHAQSCSATGTRPFDDDADGLIGAEGYVAVVVKTLERALADGDRIHAIIRGIGISADGRGRSLWAPRQEGQILAMQRAYAGEPADHEVQYLEAHATSTQVGDATELGAIATYFSPLLGNRRLLLGSIKSNIGHTLETAGMAGLLKTVLAMNHGVVPPSAGIQTPNRTIAWDEIPIDVPTRAIPWPDPSPGQPRRAGVNAFGIGGLNVHVVVESHRQDDMVANAVGTEAVQRDSRARGPRRSAPPAPDPIAIVGRGLILPGAQSPEQLAELIAMGKSKIGPAPADRWRDAHCIRDDAAGPWQCTTNVGGYITDYQFDWKTHRVPPKQIAQANPLQFMLIDAARSALAEAGYEELDLARESTAVIVGTIFGGQFAHDLVLGLRLPLIRERLHQALRARGIRDELAERVLGEFEDELFKAKPALLDETGSFTSSTLASRITKELNLAGGAFAVDAGECSSLAALDLACGMLRSGRISHAICAAAQRSMDLANYEVLSLQKRLLGSNPEAPHAGFVPGEGVVALVLKRLEDARRDGNPVFGVFHNVNAEFELGRRESRMTGASEPSKLIPIIGHTLAAHGLATFLWQTTETRGDLDAAHGKTRVTTNAAPSGLVYRAGFAVGSSQNESEGAPAREGPRRGSDPQDEAPALYRFAASTISGMASRLSAADADDAPDWIDAGRRRFTPADAVRAAIVARGQAEARKKASALLSSISSRAHNVTALATQGIYFGERIESSRIAFLFPGQGSQYAGMSLPLADASPAARRRLAECDQALFEICGERYSELIAGGDARLHDDVWAIQASMLVANVLTAAWLAELGVRPHVVAGHSYGEFAALTAAGAICIHEVLKITKARSRSLEKSSNESGGLASIHASRAEVAELVREFGDELEITHVNSPTQTVVGGKCESLARFVRFAAARERIVTVLPVPFAFHTKLLARSQPDFAAALRTAAFRPPSIPFLSSVRNRFVADPEEIRAGLVEQLVTPVDYVGLVERLIADGCNVLVEAGPQQTLTRFHQQIVGDRSIAILSADVKGRDPRAHRLHIQAQCECLGLIRDEAASMAESIGLKAEVNLAIPPVHFDATNSRRQRQRRTATSSSELRPRPTIASPPVHFDGTCGRREASRNGTDRLSPVQKGMNGRAIAAIEPNGGAALNHLVNTTPVTTRRAHGKELEQFLIDFIVDQTGYPPEIIELDWDMEADLGIDSIKKAQLFGELREIFDLENSIPIEARSRFSLDQFRTLRNVLDLLADCGGKREWITDGVGFATNEPMVDAPLALSNAPPRPSALPAAVHNDSASLHLSRGPLEQFLIDYVVDQTGYPPDIIDLDAEFEADLGIDSIKKAQLFGELRECFAIPLDAADRLSLSDFTTLRHVLDFLQKSRIVPAISESTASRRLPSAIAETPLHPPRTCVEPPITVAVSANRQDLSQVLSDFESRGRSKAFEAGSQLGRRSAPIIERCVAELVDRMPADGLQPSALREWDSLGDNDRELLAGLASGADATLEGVVAYHGMARRSSQFAPLPWPEPDAAPLGADAPLETLVDEISTDASNGNGPQHGDVGAVTTRRVLRLKLAPQLPGTPTSPELAGPALIVGHGELARKLAARISALGQQAHVFDPADSVDAAIRQFEELWNRAPTPHLFLVGAREPAAHISLECDQWNARRPRGLDVPFWLCQRWIARMSESGRMDDGSLVAVTSLGGDFGLSGRVQGIEGGALTGLLKAIVIENWMNGYRTLPVKIVDCPAEEPAESIVDAVFHELAAPSYDMEVAWSGKQRRVIRAEESPLTRAEIRPIHRGGNWIFTGGARGITAHVVEQLATQFGLRANLIGLSPYPHVSLRWRQLRQDDPRQLKIEVMSTAREAGENPVKAWERVEKSLEIDATLRRLRAAGVDVHYYSCDVSDRNALESTLHEIRRAAGPLQGIVHGAGVGKDARFEHKDRQRVAQCFDAKVGGALALMELTAEDPIEHFAAFGSISGRFGANGHTDYSAANDMLAKVVDRYRLHRPDVSAVTFHWHAWGDVGMATKPETRLALEMINMQFMPAREGVSHLLTELQAGAPEGEVLITDDRYYRLFYPSETLAATNDLARDAVNCGSDQYPLLDRGVTSMTPEGAARTTLDLDPVKDQFLAEHRLNDRPLLPIVVGLELLAEAGARLSDAHSVAEITDVKAIHGLKFPTDAAHQASTIARKAGDGVNCAVVADVRTRTGVLVEADRAFLTGTVRFERREERVSRRLASHPAKSGWQRVAYPAKGSQFYLGPPLRCLRKIQLGDGEAWGRLVAPAAVELAGPLRPVDGWIVPSAAIDACLFATGILAWFTIEPGTALPESIASLALGRSSRAGESCLVHTRFKRREDRHAWFDFTLFGVNGDVLVDVVDYRIVWLPTA